MKFDVSGLEQLRLKMPIVMPGFNGFSEGCGELLLQRSKLDKAAHDFRVLIADSHTENELSEVIVSNIIQKLRFLVAEHLGRVIHSGNSIHSVKCEFLSNKLPLEDRRNFIRELAALVNEEVNLQLRLDSFVSALLPLLGLRYPDPKDKRYDVTRSLPTFLLMLIKPKVHICVATGLTKSLCKTLKISTPIKGDTVFDINQYEHFRALAVGLFDVIEQWGWEPRDMVDVLFFFWAAKLNGK